jgi:hypothetical protein
MLPFLFRLVTIINIPTLIDLTNDLAYLILLSKSLVEAFLDSFIQNTDFRELEGEGLGSSIF